MAFQDFNTSNVAANAAGVSNGNKPKAKYWLNVGSMLNLPDPETGVLRLEFVPLPFGLALDTMQPTSGNGRFANLRNGMLKHVLQACQSLEPGQAVFVNPNAQEGELQIQIQARSEAQAMPDAEAEAINAVKLNFG